MLRRLFLLAVTAALAACSADHKSASDAEVAAAIYVAGPPASITLITSINGRSGAGAHSALVINGSQRVLYDPAGSWELTGGLAPKRNDLHFGMTAPFLKSYIDFQAGGVFYVVSQTLLVPQAVADQAIAAAVIQGAAPKAYCSHYVSAVLRRLPGLDALPETFFPKVLSRGFAKVPGVTGQTINGDDKGLADPAAAKAIN